MGKKIGKISPIKRTYDTSAGRTLSSSLSENNLSMFPGTFKTIPPFKEKNGDYRTGLDPNALYIKLMPEGEREQEQVRVTAEKERLEQLTGLDLSPRSSYYYAIYDEGSFGEETRASYVKLIDGPNVFNLSDARSAITFAWLRVHPEIAPTYSAWEKGLDSHRCPDISSCRFFVDDEEFESEVAFKEKSLINKAINLLETMTPTRLLKVAKLLNLPVAYDGKAEGVYNEIDEYIKAASVKGAHRLTNVRNFMKTAQMADENINIRFTVKQALDFNVYRLGKGGKIYEAEVQIADNEEDLVEHLSNPKHQDDYLALEKKISTAKSILV